jgi:putative heme-binding domain-containing protein
MSRTLSLFTLLFAVAAAPAATPVPRAPSGFRVELILEAPDIEAPTALAVASNGDVYYADDPMDMRGPPTQNLDRIWLLRGGDPKQRVVFADKMWAVMGMELVGSRLFVVHPPHVTVFTLNPDGTARDRRELFADLGPKVAGLPSFNDHVPSGIRLGMDGYLYVSIGDKGIPRMHTANGGASGPRGRGADAAPAAGTVETAEGRRRRLPNGPGISLEGGGVIRFKPDGSRLEVFASGTRNHLDVPLDEHDRIFVRDNTDDGLGWWTRLMYLPRGGFLGYPWAYTRRPQETLPMVRDFGGGAPCGGWVYLDDGLPETYRGRVFHCEWGQGKVFGVKLAPDGAGFKFVDQITLLDPEGTGLKDFRPFTLRPTADGRGFYVADWGFGGWLASKKAGRLWKVTYMGNGTPAPRGRDTDPADQLIAALGHPAHSERLRAQRTLLERGLASDVERAVVAGRVTGVARRHALWVLREADSPRWTGVAIGLTESPDVNDRFEASRALGTFTRATLPAKPYAADILARLTKLLTQDTAPAVRHQAAVALADLADPAACVRALLALENESDPYVRLAVVRMLKSQRNWVGLAQHRAAEVGPKAREVLFMALAEEFDLEALELLNRLARSPDAGVRCAAVETLARNYKDRKPYAGTWWGTQPASTPPPPREVAWAGTPQVRDAVVRALADRDPGVRKAAVATLVTWSDPETLGPLVERFRIETDPEARLDLVRAAAGMTTPKTVPFLTEVFADASLPEALRQEAIAGLERAGNGEAVRTLVAGLSRDPPLLLQSRTLTALGTLKARPGRDAVRQALRSPQAPVRQAAALALAGVGTAQDADVLLPLLNDPSTSVRAAAVQSLGALQARSAVPHLVPLAGAGPLQFEAIQALTKMPDARALPAYLTGLASKNADLRAACRQALAAVRDQVAPALEDLAKRNELTAPVIAELQVVYTAYVPVTAWKLIGPFPDSPQAFPPELEQKFDAAYDGAGKQVRWRDRAAQPPHGRVNLAALYDPNTGVVAYGYAEFTSDVERDAKLAIGSDDTITVWLNGAKVHEFGESRGWAPQQDIVPVKLRAGQNRLLIKCGNFGGPWEFSVAVSADTSRYGFLKGGAAKFNLESFRDFARSTPGDAERGRKLFLDTRGLACVKCHAVGGQGGTVGPDLAGIGLKYGREDLMTSILEPSKTIAQGYETVSILTNAGKPLTGVFKGETADAIRLTDAEGKEHVVPKSAIEEKNFPPVSTMPNGLSDGMTMQDFADIIAYLEAMKGKK